MLGIKLIREVVFIKNGQPVSDWLSYTTDAIESDYDMTIGDCEAYSHPWDGLIDDVKIYNYARSPAQIQMDYNAGFGTHLK